MQPAKTKAVTMDEAIANKIEVMELLEIPLANIERWLAQRPFGSAWRPRA
ncbi:MAG: hypothetical protein H0X34_05875 [Chthoniobacterales bacterium]|nr:hypothetical protein [Chthoniobacterales bacterium]